MKKFFKFGCLGLVAIFVLFAALALFAGDDTTETTSGNVSSKPADKKEEKVPEFGLNEEVTVDKFAYTVKGVSETKQIEAEYLDPLTSDSGKFVVVDVTFLNKDKSARLLDTDLFKLTTEDGTEYSASTDADFQLNGDSTMFLEEVNPNATRTGKIAFEVPADAADFTLNVSSGLGWSGGEYAKIKLQ